MPKLSKTAEKLPKYDLLAVREKLDLSQQEMAELISASQASVARWETEGTAPKLVRDYLALYMKHAKPPKGKKTT